MEMVYFHKYNVVKPTYSMPNAWRRFIHCECITSTTVTTEILIIDFALATWVVANGKPVYS